VDEVVGADELDELPLAKVHRASPVVRKSHVLGETREPDTRVRREPSSRSIGAIAGRVVYYDNLK
jgi:hypothetical protein